MSVKMNRTIKLISALLIGILILALVIVAFSYVFGYQGKLDEAARQKTIASLKSDATRMEEYINTICDVTREMSVAASLEKDETSFYKVLSDFCISPEQGNLSEEEYSKLLATKPKCVRIVNKDKFYSSVTHNENYSESVVVRSALEEYNLDPKHKIIGVAYDAATAMNLLSVITPVYDNPIGRAIVVYFPVEMLNYGAPEDTMASFYALASSEGVIMNIIKNDKKLTDDITMTDQLLKLVDDGNSKVEIQKMFTEMKDDMKIANFNAVKYAIGQNVLLSETSNLKLVGVYATHDIFATENSFYQTLTILIVFFAVVMLAFIGFYIFKFIRSIILSRTELWKAKYNCYTYDGFLEKASDIATSLKGSKFVVVATEIRFYKLLLEKGENYHVPFNRAVSNIISKDINRRYETYGYGTSGRFYMLLHYTNEKELEARLENLNKQCAKHKIENERKLQIVFGACELNSQHEVVPAAVNAQEALAKSIEYIGIRDFTMYVYDEDEEKLDKDYIEMNAEKALAKDEFKVFFQPKYNIAKNCVDGAEALMRWYIPAENRFYPPAAFLPVIETNGFISRVDVYVFEQVCKYLRKSLDQGERVYPISVNVSRFTVMQDNFVEKYAGIKKKYKIRDGLLWIEFTESSDLQDYDFISEIITQLHAAGFKCSIDDFGTGYSSYECLKTLDLDEIKLDRFYVIDELKSERDCVIVRNVIDLGRALNMKVTVEGVADQETFNKLKEYGCEVIQGFLYSRPLPLADYVSFINSAYRGAFE